MYIHTYLHKRGYAYRHIHPVSENLAHTDPFSSLYTWMISYINLSIRIAYACIDMYIVIWDGALWFWSVIKTIMTDWHVHIHTHMHAYRWCPIILMQHCLWLRNLEGQLLSRSSSVLASLLWVWNQISRSESMCIYVYVCVWVQLLSTSSAMAVVCYGSATIFPGSATTFPGSATTFPVVGCMNVSFSVLLYMCYMCLTCSYYVFMCVELFSRFFACYDASTTPHIFLCARVLFEASLRPHVLFSHVVFSKYSKKRWRWCHHATARPYVAW